MKKAKKFLVGLLAFASITAFAFGMTGCDDEKPSAGTGNGTNTEQGSGNTDDDNTEQGGGNTDNDNTEQDKDIGDENKIEFKTLKIDGTNVYGIVNNNTETFSFINEVTIKGAAKYIVSLDVYGEQQVATKTIKLEIGDNSVYLTEIIDDEPVNIYTVTIRRKPNYTVYFQTNGGGSVQNQTVEEGGLAVQPEDVSRAGYDFGGWDFDFTKPIIKNETVYALWTAHTDTPYKVEYYLENLNDSRYTLYETENLAGTTGELVTAEIKEYSHFTYNSWGSDESGYILGDGTKVLKVYYDRNRYSITLNRINNKGTVTGGGRYANAEEVTVRALVDQGYSFDGWYEGNEKISENAEYTFNPVSDITLTAKWTVDTDTPYKVEYYWENINDNGYTLHETENLTGTTNETATAEIKEYAHFKYDRYNDNGKTSGTILGDGTQVLKVYYNRNTYNLSLDYSCLGGDITNTGTYKYGTNIVSVAVPYLGYILDGWYHEDQKISSLSEYEFLIDKNIVVRFSLKEEMSIFNFTSTIDICKITALKDKTLSQAVIPNYVTAIGHGAFSDCERLTSIAIPNSVMTIEYSAFSGCASLTSVTIPDSVTTIEDSAFRGCDSLVSVTIPDSVTTIGESAFSSCDSLVSVIITNSVKTIEDWAFFFCDKLKEIYYKGTSSEWNNIWIGDTANDDLTSAKKYYYVENEEDVPHDGGNYWHYVDGVVTKW